MGLKEGQYISIDEDHVDLHEEYEKGGLIYDREVFGEPISE